MAGHHVAEHPPASEKQQSSAGQYNTAARTGHEGQWYITATNFLIIKALTQISGDQMVVDDETEVGHHWGPVAGGAGH